MSLITLIPYRAKVKNEISRKKSTRRGEISKKISSRKRGLSSEVNRKIIKLGIRSEAMIKSAPEKNIREDKRNSEGIYRSIIKKTG